MPTSYTSLLGLALPVTGELSGTWGDTVNDYITQYLDAAVAGAQTISGSQTAVTLSKTTASSLTQAGSGSTGSSQYQIINCTGNPAGLLTITVPAASKAYLVLNSTSTSQSVKVVGAGPTTGVTMVSGERALIAWDGSDFVKVASSTADGVTTLSFGTTGLTPNSATAGAITVAGTLVAANGGTGQSSYTTGDLLYATGSTALSKLGIGTNGQVLTSTGTAPQWSTLSGVAVTTFSAGTTGFTPSTATSGAVTLGGTLATTNGGTGLTSFTANGVVYASSTSALTTGSALTFDGTTLNTKGQFRVTDSTNAANYLLFGSGANAPRGGNALTAQTGSLVFATESANPMIFVTNAVEAARLDSSGNLGLGVTPSAWGAGSQAFQNGGGAVFQYNNDRIFIGQNSYIDSSFADRFIGNGYATRYRQYQGTHAFYVSTVSNSSGAGASQTLTQAMTLDANGSLAVGGTTVVTNNGGITATTTVSGSVAATLAMRNAGTGNGSGTTLVFRGVSNASAEHDYAYVAGVADDTTAKTGSIRFSTTAGSSPVERARITSGGDLLVGTTSASALAGSGRGLIELNGSTDSVYSYKSNNTLVGYTLGSSSEIRVATSTAIPLTFYTNATERARITSGGQIAASSAGTAAAPVITKSDDLDTGIFFPAANELAFAVNGVEELRITSAGFTRPVAYADTVSALGNTGTATTINLLNANVFTATLTGNCTFTLSNPIATGSSSFTLILTNDGTAGRTVAWAGGSFVFPGGAAALSRTTTANAVDVWVFFTPNGGTTWYGNIAMKDMKA
jgi:hypothetical protein